LIKNAIVFLLAFTLVYQVLTFQHLDAQNTIQVSKFPAGTDAGLEDQPTTTDENEPTTTDENEPTTTDENEPTTTDENEPTTTDEKGEERVKEESNKTNSEQVEVEEEKETPKVIPPKKFGSDLAAANMTTSNLTATNLSYKVKINFRSIIVFNDHDPIGSGCGEYDLAAYVQGYRVLPVSDPALWHVCAESAPGGTELFFGYNTFEYGAFVAKPGESFWDLPPLSIMTIGVEVDDCGKVTWPKEIKEIKDILADKGATRPYYAGAKEKIAKIQSDMTWFAQGGGIVLPNYAQYLHCTASNKNDMLSSINDLYYPPSYGSQGPIVISYQPVRGHYISAAGEDFYLTYDITCDECPVKRVH
jgi:hypothetical protein